MSEPESEETSRVQLPALCQWDFANVSPPAALTTGAAVSSICRNDFVSEAGLLESGCDLHQNRAGGG